MLCFEIWQSVDASKNGQGFVAGYLTIFDSLVHSKEFSDEQEEEGVHQNDLCRLLVEVQRVWKR